MPTGINASIVTLTNGTTANAPDVLNSLNSLNSNGVSNDGGAITTNGAGMFSLPGLIVNPTGATLNGSTSGTATLYQPERGTWKEVFVVLNNFRNAGGSTQTLSIPVPFTTFCRVETEDLFQIALQIGSTAQSIKVLTGLVSTGGSTATQTNIAANSLGSCLAAVDTIGFLNGGSGGMSSIIYLRGV